MVILDLDLPDLDGIEVTRLRRQWTRVPILIISTNDVEATEIAALDAGADDYVTKVSSDRKPLGLHLSFYAGDEGRCLARFHPNPEHEGCAGHLHGGIISSLLDVPTQISMHSDPLPV